MLRIEDTDAERLVGHGRRHRRRLRWLGAGLDEGLDVRRAARHFQSQRLDRHRAPRQLVLEQRAYYCYCTPAVIQEKRAAVSAAAAAGCDRTCCALSGDEIARLEAAGTPRAVRFKVPAGRTAFTDLVHGAIAFDTPTSKTS